MSAISMVPPECAAMAENAVRAPLSLVSSQPRTASVTSVNRIRMASAMRNSLAAVFGRVASEAIADRKVNTGLMHCMAVGEIDVDGPDRAGPSRADTGSLLETEATP